MTDTANSSNPNDKKQSRLETLRAKKAALEAEIAKLNAAQASAQRKLDTRKKILIGAVVMEEANANPKVADWLNGQLNKGLKAARDRAVFGLPPLDNETKGNAENDNGK